jgi:hypothetical protein
VCAAPDDAPSAITFSLVLADCHGAGADTLTLRMNGFILAAVPTARGCDCYSAPQTVTVTDPGLLAHYETDACNWFSVTSSPHSINFAVVKVTLTFPETVTEHCVFDGNAHEPLPHVRTALRLRPAGRYHHRTVGGADADGDGVTGGLGPSCDNCATRSNSRPGGHGRGWRR